MKYNLLEERWLPVLWTDGQFARLGITETLTQAARIRRIATSNPMDGVAVIRFLLALLYWCRGNPPTTLGAVSGESFPIGWFARLDTSKECFNLLGDGERFYQCREQGDKVLAASYLIHEIPSGTNLNHFRRSDDGVNGLCPACCALGLLRLPVFSTQGGQGKSPGINAKPPIYVIPVGETLAETLQLSWRPVSNLGTPAWERPDVQLPSTGEVPLLTGLTWLPRRVWLDEPGESLSRCILCGRRDKVILLSVFAGKGSSKTDDGTRRVWHDPHVIYKQGKSGETSLHSTDVVGRADAGAGQWARMMAELLEHPRAERSRAWVVGFSSDQNKYREASELFLPWPVSPVSRACIEKLSQWQRSSSNLDQELRRLHDRPSRKDRIEIDPQLAAIRSHVERRVAARAEELLSGGEAEWEHASGAYMPMMRMIARSLSPGFTSAATRRRRQIADMKPEIVQSQEARKTPARVRRGIT